MDSRARTAGEVPVDEAEVGGPAHVPPLRATRGGRPRGGRFLAAAAAAATVTAAVLAASGVGVADPFGDADQVAAASGDRPPATAAVTRQTLVESLSKNGDLGYGTASTLTARRSGTLTALPAGGSVVDRGEAMYRVDDEPVVLLHGALPAYRRLASGVEGPDVEQLEQNLAALGYRGFTVDEEYTSATAAAVRKWQDDLGVDETGAVDPADVVVASGPARVESHTAALGELLQPGAAVLSYTGTERRVTVTLELDEQRLAPVGAEVEVELPDGRSVDGRVVESVTVVERGPSGPDGEGDPTTQVRVTVRAVDPAALQGLDIAAVRVLFTASQRPDVLTVPVAALLALPGGGYGVQAVEAGGTRTLRVQLGLFSEGRVEVSGEGLSEGMRVGVPE